MKSAIYRGSSDINFFLPAWQLILCQPSILKALISDFLISCGGDSLETMASASSLEELFSTNRISEAEICLCTSIDLRGWPITIHIISG